MITYKKLRDYNGGITDNFQYNHQSEYEFSEPLTKGFHCGEVYNLDKPTRFVQVSDAREHIERIVFPLYIIENYTDDDFRNNTKECCMRGNPCEGVWTMMIHGGDIYSIEPINNYLDRLVSYNS